jgi:phosphoribosylformylglycinamidine synthase
MTEMIYPKPLESFNIPNFSRESWFLIPVMEKGRSALEEANLNLGLAWDEWDLDFYDSLFREKVNSTIRRTMLKNYITN